MKLKKLNKYGHPVCQKVVAGKQCCRAIYRGMFCYGHQEPDKSKSDPRYPGFVL